MTRVRAKKKWFPSDPIPSTAHRRHATALSTAIRSAERFAFLLPGHWFVQLPAQSFLARRSFLILLNGTGRS